jgi:hypothetical protein
MTSSEPGAARGTGAGRVTGAGRRGPCVVHLVWAPLGPEPLRQFLASYHRHAAGVPHRLVVLLNGATSDASRDVLLRELEHTDHRLIVLETPVLDLLAYRRAAAMLSASHYCFLNSHSRILADDWLAHLDRALAEPDVGLAAASGSWASMLSYALFQLGLPSAYGNVFDDRDSTRRQFERLHHQRTGEAPSSDPLRRRLGTAIALSRMLIGFLRFPAQHVRTNAFAIEHDLLMSASRSAVRRKVQAHRLESGRDSFTRQVERRGLRAVVVDRRGRLYDAPDWPDSETFWQGAQRGLLVADNQTADYDRADAERRLLLSRYAWGDRAAPL